MTTRRAPARSRRAPANLRFILAGLMCVVALTASGADITILAGFGPGGGEGSPLSRRTAAGALAPQPGLDHFARLTARHLHRFVELQGGNAAQPVRLRHMPGGGGRIAASALLAGPARSDSAEITLAVLPAGFFMDMAFPDPALPSGSERIDLARLAPLGGRIADEFLCVARANGARTVADVSATSIVGATAPGQRAYIHARILALLAPAPPRIVPGYRDMNDAVRALQRGEVEIICGWSHEDIRSRSGAGLDLRSLAPILRFTPPAGSSRLPSVADAQAASKDTVLRDAIAALAWEGALVATLVARADAPAEQLAVLRKAFVSMLRDPEVRREALRRNLQVDPVPAERIARALGALGALAPDVRALLRRAETLQAGP
jgi:hypothetical protein